MRQAAILATAYIAFCIAYILVSGRIAAALATSASDLQHIEAVKGVLFIMITGVMLFAVTFAQLKRIRSNEIMMRMQERTILQTERRSVAAMSAASMAHDLNNLLLSLLGLVEELKRREQSDAYLITLRKDIEVATDKVLQLSRRLTTVTKDILPDERSEVNLTSTIGQIVAISRKHPDVKQCSILMPERDGIHVVLNTDLFEQAMLNLIINAAQAAEEGGTIEVRVAREKDLAAVEVHDSGPGIPDAIRSRIFDPCFTTKTDSTGIGLLAVKAFAASHAGEVQVSESPWGGALFRLRFPVEPES